MNGEVLGYITCSINKDLNAFINVKFGLPGISAVSSSAQLQGIYKTLIKSMLEWNSEKVDIAEMGTYICNYPVIKTLQKTGLELTSSCYVLHMLINHF